MQIRVGEVEGAQHAGEELSVHETVDRASVVIGFEKTYGRTSHPGIQSAGGGEQGVAQLFEFQSAQREVREPAVLGIEFLDSVPFIRTAPIVSLGSRLVCGAGDDEPVQCLEAPA